MKKDNNTRDELISKGAILLDSPHSHEEWERIKTEEKKIIQNKDKIVLEDILPKLNKLERENILYTRSRWEFLRRNEEFVTDYIKGAREGSFARYFEFDKIDKLTEKMLYHWKIGCPYRLHPSRSFEEHVLLFFDMHVTGPVSEAVVDFTDSDAYSKLVSGNEAYIRSCRFVGSLICSDLSKMVSVNSPITCSPYEVDYEYDNDSPTLIKHILISDKLKETGQLDVTIDLNFSKHKILLYLEKIIEKLQPHIEVKETPDEPVRQNQSYKLYPLYVQVYDMKKSKTYEEIGREVFPKYFDPEYEEKYPKHNPENAIAKVKQHYKEAKRLIDNADGF